MKYFTINHLQCIQKSQNLRNVYNAGVCIEYTLFILSHLILGLNEKVEIW